MSRSLADSSWQEIHEKTSSSEIICKYLIWLYNSLCFYFIPLPPNFLSTWASNLDLHSQRAVLSCSPGHRPDQCHIEWKCPLEYVVNSCKRCVLQGSGWVWSSSLHQDTYISIHLCHGSRRAGAETKYCTTHVSGVHESHFYFSTKKGVISPPGPIRLHFCERPFSTRAHFDFLLFDKNVNLCYFFRCDQLWLKETFFFLYRLQKS